MNSPRTIDAFAEKHCKGKYTWYVQHYEKSFGYVGESFSTYELAKAFVSQAVKKHSFGSNRKVEIYRRDEEARYPMWEVYEEIL